MKTMNPLDAVYFVIEQREQPMHVAGLQIFKPPTDAEPDFVQKLYQSWRKQTTALAPFNQRPVNKRGQWFWETDEEFDVDYHLRHLALPQPGRIRELLALVSQLHATLLDRNRPLWELYLIEGLADGRFAIYVKIHHGLVDGVTSVRLITGALTKNSRERKPALPLWAQEFRRKAGKEGQIAALPAPSLLQSVLRALELGAKILPGLGSGLADLLRGQDVDDGTADHPRALPFQAPPSMFNVRITGSRRFVAQSYSLTRIRHIGAAAGATVNDVTLALCASVLRRYLLSHDALPKKPLIAMVPVSLHSEADNGKKGGGNKVGVILANLATHIDDPLRRLHAIVASTTAAKERLRPMSGAGKLAHAAMTMAPMLANNFTGKSRTRPAFNLVISNVPGPKEPLYLNGALLDEAYPVSIPADFMALNITVSGNGDDLGFGFIACRRTVPALQRMLDHLAEAFAELEAAIAPTPKSAPKPVGKRVKPRRAPSR